MTAAEILRRRLANQGLARAEFHEPEEVVARFGAVQAQDYLGSLWAIGQRLRRGTEARVEAAEARRAIVRLWPMRGTLHFVAAADARWITRLLAPRVIARNAARIERETGVDARLVARSRDILRRALEGGRRLERQALYDALEARRIRTGGSRGLHLLGRLAMEGTLCLAGRRGKQHTFALLDEWIPTSTLLDPDAALSELARRYFATRGPATRRDFQWWSGLTAKDSARAIDTARPALSRVLVDGDEYWWQESATARPVARTAAIRLLPAFDEYTVAYHGRSMLAEAKVPKMALLGPAVLVEGRIAGSWTRTLAREGVSVTVRPHRAWSRAESTALRSAVDGYGTFLGLEATLDSAAPARG